MMIDDGDGDGDDGGDGDGDGDGDDDGDREILYCPGTINRHVDFIRMMFT